MQLPYIIDSTMLSTYRSCLLYDERSGKVFWRKSTSNVKAGSEAGTSIGSHGYRQINLLGKNYLLHRVIFVLKTGRWPSMIDHIDGNKTNNKWENLREVDSAQNNWNRHSKVDGCSYRPHAKAWCARIKIRGKEHWLGYHKTKKDAVRAYLKAKGERDEI